MRWIPGGRSRNLEDRRGGGGMGLPGGLGGMGIGGIVLVVAFALITKQNPLALLGAMSGDGSAAVATEPIEDPAEEPQVRFVSMVLDSAQAMWHGKVEGYRDAKLVLFRDRVQSACGFAQAASGPFYCPGDEKVYIDLGFYAELKERFGAPGDFAEAYVLAHEIGHHVQKVLGTMDQVAAQGRNNAQSVKLELQADCYAGVWAHSAAQAGMLEAGDLEEGLGAASAVGDDRLQRATEGTVNPESWTHGSSAQRMEWFRRGAGSGNPAACDTFSR